MPGLGSESKLGIAKEVTPSVGVEPDSAIPFVSESFTAERPLLESETIGGSSMLKNTVPGDSAGTGGIVQEFDAETSGILLDLWNGPNGYTAPGGAFTDGQLSTAPSGSAGGSGGTIPAGNYHYRTAPIWTHDFLGEKFIMPKSNASSAVTVTSGQQVTLTVADPSALTLADHTFYGTAIYRSAAGGGAGATKYLGLIVGTGTSFVDDGSNDYADTAVSPVPNTSIYEHILEGASAAEGEDRLEYFSTQISKNVGSDERYFGNKVDTFTLAVADRASAVKLTVGTQGDDRETVAGEFVAATLIPKQQIIGRQVRIVVNGVTDCDVQALNLTGTNNCQRLSTLCGNTISEGARRVGGDITLLFRDRDLFNKAVSGEELEIQIYMRGEPLEPSGASLSLVDHGVEAIPFPRLAKFDMQRVVLGGFTNPVEGPGQIIAKATFQAKEDSVSGTDLAITLINTIDDYT